MILKHSFVYLISKGLPGIISFISVFVYTRVLLPEDYGKYAVVLAISGLLNSFLFQWLRAGVLRFLPKFKKDNRDVFINTIFFSFILISTVIGLFCFLIWISKLRIPGIEEVNTLIVFLVVLSMGWFDLNLEILRSELSPKLYGKLSLAKALLTLVISVLLIKLGLGYISLMLGVIIGNIIPLCFLFNKLWLPINIEFFRIDIFFELLRYGFPLAITFALSYLIYSSSRFLLNYFGETANTGIYSVTYDFTQQTLLLLMMIVNLASYPLIIRSLENEGIESAKKKIEENTVILFLVSLPAALGLIMLSSNICNIVFGIEYRQMASKILPIISVAGLIYGFKMYYIDLSFQLGKCTNLQIIPVIIAALANILASFILIPKYGIFGAAYSALVSYIFSIVSSMFIVKRVFPLPFPKYEVIKIIISAIFMCIAIYPIIHYKGLEALFMQILVGIIVYLLFLYILNVDDIRLKISKLINKKGLAKKENINEEI
jgi:O-antigen/teichoic acid export membrane protein